jgi:hypothetical protein
VAKTGECTLYSDLPFKPDRFYMYQIFILDEDAPNYDPSKSENPYKFFAGVSLPNIGHDIEEYYYLGGQNFDYNNRSNMLSAYSNHRIGDTNQYMCFI